MSADFYTFSFDGDKNEQSGPSSQPTPNKNEEQPPQLPAKNGKGTPPSKSVVSPTTQPTPEKKETPPVPPRVRRVRDRRVNEAPEKTSSINIANVIDNKKSLGEVFASLSGDSNAGLFEKLFDLLQFAGSVKSLNYLLTLVNFISYEPLLKTAENSSTEALIIPLLMAISNLIESLINKKNKTLTFFEKAEIPLLTPTIALSIYSGLQGSGILKQTLSDIPESLRSLLLANGNLNNLPELAQVIATAGMIAYLLNNFSQVLISTGVFVEWIGGALHTLSEKIEDAKNKVERATFNSPIKNALIGGAIVNGAMVAAHYSEVVDWELLNLIFQNDYLNTGILFSVPAFLILSNPHLLLKAPAIMAGFLSVVVKVLGLVEGALGAKIQQTTK